ncbi:MAG: ATP-binding protein, partial [Anaerolineaceae bacterium]|nr:ATP-binding protein [Anaerolineaceae bacterium]
IFGPSHAAEIAAACGAPVSAQMPINPLVATLGDAGKIEEVPTPEDLDALADSILALK